MKITRIETFATPAVGFVRITDETGAQGWGQVSTYNADITVQVLHRQIAPWTVGETITDLDDHLDRISEREHKFPGSYLCRAMCGLDTAIWDLRGKQAGKPVAALLGGTAGPLRAYASSMRRDITPKDEAARLLRLRDEQGFDAFKFRVGSECGRDRDEWEGRTEEIIPLMAREMGPDVDLLADANSCYSLPRAIEVGRMMEANGLVHFEEPCPYWEMEQTRAVTQALDIDVTGGEQDWDLTHWRRMIDMRAVDIVQPDICYLGRHFPHAACGQDGAGGRAAGDAALRQLVDGDAVHDAPAARDPECGQISGILHRGAGILSVAIRPVPQ